MFEKVEYRCGIIENMSTHICSKCGHESTSSARAAGCVWPKRYEVTIWAPSARHPHPRGRGRRQTHRGQGPGWAARADLPRDRAHRTAPLAEEGLFGQVPVDRHPKYLIIIFDAEARRRRERKGQPHLSAQGLATRLRGWSTRRDFLSPLRLCDFASKYTNNEHQVR